MIENMTVLQYIIVLLRIQSTICLRGVYMIVPDAAEKGAKTEMKCLYDLEGQELYTVKWYRGDREFCRYTLRDVPPIRVFRIPGIEVQETETDANRLVIKAESEVAQGQYTCEVSADAPSFHTAMVNAHMYVVVLPKEGPSMYGMKQRYKAGMKLNVECVSSDSIPAANLSFYVNNEPALSQHVFHRVDGQQADGLMSAYSTIQFTVQKHHLLKRKIKIRCTAIIYSIYLKSLEKSAEEVRVRTTPASLPEVKRTYIKPVHREAEKKGSSQGVLACINTNLSLIMFTLPTFLNMLYNC